MDIHNMYKFTCNFSKNPGLLLILQVLVQVLQVSKKESILF